MTQPDQMRDMKSLPVEPNDITDTQHIIVAPHEQVSRICGGDIINTVSQDTTNESGIAEKDLTLSSSPNQPRCEAITDMLTANQNSSNVTRSSNSTGFVHSDTEKFSLMRKKLIVLLHAHECVRRVRDIENNQSECILKHCKTMKEVIKHMTSCKMYKDCTVPYCSPSRRIIAHWKNCERQHCPICSSLRWSGKCDNNTLTVTGLTDISSHAASIRNDPQQDIISHKIPDIGGQNQQQQQLIQLQKKSQRTIASPPNSLCSQPTQLKEEIRSKSIQSIKSFESNFGKLQMQFPTSPIEAVHFTKSKKRDASILMEPTRAKRHRSNEPEHIQQLSPNNQRQNVTMQFQMVNHLQQTTESLDSASVSLLHKSIAECTLSPSLSTYHKSKPLTTSTSGIKSSNLIVTSNDVFDIFRPIQSTSIVDVDRLSSQTADNDKDFYFNKRRNINLGTNTELKYDPISDGIGNERPPVVSQLNQPIQSDEGKCFFESEDLRQALMPTFEKMYQQVPESLAFREPVDVLVAPNYYEIIHKPMDLNTIKCKLNSGQYSDPWEYVDDVYLMFENAKLFNRTTTRVYKHCIKLLEIFENEINPVMQTLGYCCGNKYTFRQKKLYCYGKLLCIIPRSTTYFNYERYNFCQKCFLGIPRNDIILCDTQSQCQVLLHKNQFMKLTNDRVELEQFVTCLDCGRKQHTICVLYLEKIWPDGFLCENCMKKKGAKRKENKFKAKSLPVTNLSFYIEERVNKFLKEKEVNVGEVHIRVLSSFDKIFEVKQEMRNRFVKSGQLDSEFSYRGKAIFAFIELDDVDVCCFGMHVQEYGSDCANPNKRRVNIAYLDSVHFFQPRQYRTDVYHEILLGYMNYVKKQGYTIFHIWACPPPEDDDYIFYGHPIDQRKPNQTRLQMWYRKMLEKGKNEQTILDYEDIFEYAMKNKLNSAAQLPYFEGDFWPNFLEKIIKILDRNQEKKRILAEAAIISKENNVKSHCKKKRRKKSKKSYISKAAQKHSSQYTGNDLSDRIFTMMEIHKEAFFVIRLHSEQSAKRLNAIQDPDPLINCDLMDGPDGFMALARDKNFEFSSLRRAKFSTLNMLYELHNHENNFVFTCNNCKTQIKARYHCRVCNDYDLCIGCKEIIGHDHEMDKLEENSSSSHLQKTKPQYLSKNLIDKRAETLAHVYQCRDTNCQTPSCKNMKEVVHHSSSCSKKTKGNCLICKKLIAVCCYHARNCQDDMCPVMFCHNLKTKLKQQLMQQRLQQAQQMSRRMAVLNTGKIPTTQDPMNGGISRLSPSYSYYLLGAVNQQQKPNLMMDDRDTMISELAHPNDGNV